MSKVILCYNITYKQKGYKMYETRKDILNKIEGLKLCQDNLNSQNKDYGTLFLAYSTEISALIRLLAFIK